MRDELQHARTRSDHHRWPLPALAFSACARRSRNPTTADSQIPQSASPPRSMPVRAKSRARVPTSRWRTRATHNSPGCDDGLADRDGGGLHACTCARRTADHPHARQGRRAGGAGRDRDVHGFDHPSYVGADVPALISIESSLAEGAAGSFKVISTSQNGYALSVASGSGTTSRIERSASGAVRRDCSAPQTVDCPADGAW